MGNKFGKKTKYDSEIKFLHRPSSPPEGQEFSYWKTVPSTVPGYDYEYIPVYKKKIDSATTREERSGTLQENHSGSHLESIPETDEENDVEKEEKDGEKKFVFPIQYLEKLATQGGFSYAC